MLIPHKGRLLWWHMMAVRTIVYLAASRVRAFLVFRQVSLLQGSKRIGSRVFTNTHTHNICTHLYS